MQRNQQDNLSLFVHGLTKSLPLSSILRELKKSQTDPGAIITLTSMLLALITLFVSAAGLILAHR